MSPYRSAARPALASRAPRASLWRLLDAWSRGVFSRMARHRLWRRHRKLGCGLCLRGWGWSHTLRP
jgi:hypothetical protein